MARRVSFRQSLLRNLALLIVVVSGSTLAVTFLGARTAVRKLSGAHINKTIERLDGRLHRFFDPIDAQLRIARAWGEAGLLDLERPEQLVLQLAPLLEVTPQISAVMLAESARGMTLARTQAGVRLRLMDVEARGNRAHWFEWSAGSSEPTERWDDQAFDPRTRPWFTGAAQAGDRVHWSEPYTFFGSDAPGISASMGYSSASGTFRVIGFDILLEDVSQFTMGQRPSPNGLAFAFTESGQVIGLPRDARFEDREARRAALLVRPAELGMPAVSVAAQTFNALGAPRAEAFRFRAAGRPWWAEVRPFELAPDRGLLVAVLVPEADVLGDLTRLRIGIVLMALAALGLALVQAVVLSRRFGHPLEALVRQSDRISRGDLDPGERVEATVREVERLARAQDRMRTALQSLLKLERDLQLARQIQQRSLPEQLPRLPGFELAAWTQPAEETGGDAYDAIGLAPAQSGHRGLVLSADRATQALLLMADASGHGIGPALLATEIRAMLRMAARSGVDLASLIRNLNEQLCDDLSGGRFITAWLAQLDAREHTLSSFSAGQAPILRYAAAEDRFEIREADAPPFGVVAELEVAVPEPVVMDPGDLVLVASDGVFETADSSGARFGTERVMQVVASQREKSAEAILAALRAALTRFARGKRAADDRTALLIKRSGRR